MNHYSKRLDLSSRWLELNAPILLEKGEPAALLLLPEEAYQYHYGKWVNRRWAELMRVLAPLIEMVRDDPPNKRIEYSCFYDMTKDVFVVEAQESLARPRVRFLVLDEGMTLDALPDSVIGHYVCD